MGAEWCHADRRIDMTKLIVAFGNFANAPKKGLKYKKTWNLKTRNLIVQYKTGLFLRKFKNVWAINLQTEEEINISF